MSTENKELKMNELKQGDRSNQLVEQSVVVPAVDQLADLHINERQAAEVKGGPGLLIPAMLDHKGRPMY